jgi:hypothetical protein
VLYVRSSSVGWVAVEVCADQSRYRTMQDVSEAGLSRWTLWRFMHLAWLRTCAIFGPDGVVAPPPIMGGCRARVRSGALEVTGGSFLWSSW